jgi:four helix bundle protein
MADSRNLRVLDAAEDLSATVSAAAQRISDANAYAVKMQIIASAESIAANIGEAANLGTDANFARQLRIALASANETAVHLRNIRRKGALDPITIHRCQTKVMVVCKMLVNLIRSIEEREAHREDQRRSS